MIIIETIHQKHFINKILLLMQLMIINYHIKININLKLTKKVYKYYLFKILPEVVRLYQKNYMSKFIIEDMKN